MKNFSKFSDSKVLLCMLLLQERSNSIRFKVVNLMLDLIELICFVLNLDIVFGFGFGFELEVEFD
jgi:hypothetical protein